MKLVIGKTKFLIRNNQPISAPLYKAELSNILSFFGVPHTLKPINNGYEIDLQKKEHFALLERIARSLNVKIQNPHLQKNEELLDLIQFTDSYDLKSISYDYSLYICQKAGQQILLYRPSTPNNLVVVDGQILLWRSFIPDNWFYYNSYLIYSKAQLIAPDITVTKDKHYNHLYVQFPAKIKTWDAAVQFYKLQPNALNKVMLFLIKTAVVDYISGLQRTADELIVTKELSVTPSSFIFGYDSGNVDVNHFTDFLQKFVNRLKLPNVEYDQQLIFNNLQRWWDSIKSPFLATIKKVVYNYFQKTQLSEDSSFTLGGTADYLLGNITKRFELLDSYITNNSSALFILKGGDLQGNQSATGESENLAVMYLKIHNFVDDSSILLPDYKIPHFTVLTQICNHSYDILISAAQLCSRGTKIAAFGPFA